jgi:hypothetical protein
VKDEEFQPIIIFGQDKPAFHQFLIKSKKWTGPKGACTLLPKSDSIALLVSASISRDTGFEFGLELDSTKLLDEQFSLQGKKYTNKAASMDVSRISKNCLSSNTLSLQQIRKATGDTTIYGAAVERLC